MKNRQAPRSVAGEKNGALLAAAGFFCFLALCVPTLSVPAAIPGWYLGASVFAFLAYAADKSAARRNARRTPEHTLHLLSLAGGWPGALVAQQLLRHKTKKESFRAVFRVTVVVNCAVLALCLSPPGSAMLRDLLGTAASA